MKLEFFYMPTPDLDRSLALYRDTLGFEELWREGETTVAVAAPGSETALMLDAAPMEGWGAGPMFVCDDVAAFHASHDGGYELSLPPFEIPGGFMSGFKDPGGTPVYVMDQSREAVQ